MQPDFYGELTPIRQATPSPLSSEYRGEGSDNKRRGMGGTVRWRDEAGMLLLRMVVGLYVLNLGYLGEGSFTQLKDYQFVSKTFSNNSDNPSKGGNRFRD